MNKISKKLLVLFLAFFIGSYFSIDSVQAQNNKLILEATKECDIQYSGDSCIAELKLTNNTNEILGGEAILHIDYQGVCGDGFFDGEGIEAQFSIDNTNWLDFSDWENGSAKVSSFEIAKGESWPKLKIETISILCPGKYTFTLALKGTTGETGEEYKTSPIAIGSGEGGVFLEEDIDKEINGNDDGKVSGASDGYQKIPDVLDNNSAIISYPKHTIQKAEDFTREFVESFSTKNDKNEGKVKGEKDEKIEEKDAGEKSTGEEVFKDEPLFKIWWWLILFLLFLIIVEILYYHRKKIH